MHLLLAVAADAGGMLAHQLGEHHVEDDERGGNADEQKPQVAVAGRDGLDAHAGDLASGNEPHGRRDEQQVLRANFEHGEFSFD